WVRGWSRTARRHARGSRRGTPSSVSPGKPSRGSTICTACSSPRGSVRARRSPSCATPTVSSCRSSRKSPRLATAEKGASHARYECPCRGSAPCRDSGARLHAAQRPGSDRVAAGLPWPAGDPGVLSRGLEPGLRDKTPGSRSEEHTSELQSRGHLVCRLLLEKKKKH